MSLQHQLSALCQVIVTLSQVIPVKLDRRIRGVEVQCLFQRPPSALSQVIVGKVDRRKRGAEAQCLCHQWISGGRCLLRTSWSFRQGFPGSP